MDRLEEDSIVNILQCMSLSERLSFAQVNSRFNHAASMRLLWRNVAVTVTDTQVLLSVDSEHPPSPVSDIGAYSKRYGEFAHSLDLTVNVPFGYDKLAHARVEQIVNALTLVNLQTLTLRFPDFGNKYKFRAFFSAIKSSLRKFEVISRYPNVGMFFVVEISETEPPELRELSLMYVRNPTRPLASWLTSLMLEGIEEASKKSCCSQEDIDKLCHAIKMCSKLSVFKTNLLTTSLLEAFSNVLKLRPFSLVLVVNEASIMDGSNRGNYSQPLGDYSHPDVVLQVTSIKDVFALQKLPTVLPVKKLQLLVTNVRSVSDVIPVIRVVVEKFPDRLRSIYLDINKRIGTMEAEAMEWIRKNYPWLIIDDYFLANSGSSMF